ncbi:MAG: ABC transporter permease, partial [Clostridia bacterium]|nr:ABC transporter permease [Clostridia bacterium]
MSLLKHPKLEQLEESCSAQIQAALSHPDAFEFAPYDEAETERTGVSNYSYWRSTFQAFRKRKVAMTLLFIVLLILLFTFIQPHLPNQFDPFLVNNNPETGLPLKNTPPDGIHWMGTNAIGQDLWSQVWAGTRTSLFIGISVACVEALIGILIGVLWGYVRKLDFLFTEIYNVIDNIPSTIVLILISYILRPGVGTIIFALSLTGWIGMARFIRNQILIIRDRDYNMASRCLGTGTFRIIFRNLLPYLVSVIMLRMALSVPSAIGSEVFITYIGLGVPATVSSLGNLINVGRKLMMS